MMSLWNPQVLSSTSGRPLPSVRRNVNGTDIITVNLRPEDNSVIAQSSQQQNYSSDSIKLGQRPPVLLQYSNDATSFPPSMPHTSVSDPNSPIIGDDGFQDDEILTADLHGPSHIAATPSADALNITKQDEFDYFVGYEDRLDPKPARQENKKEYAKAFNDRTYRRQKAVRNNMLEAEKKEISNNVRKTLEYKNASVQKKRTLLGNAQKTRISEIIQGRYPNTTVSKSKK